MTFEAWRTLVKLAFQGGEPTHAALIRAVTDGARSITVRDVESDLALARSYENSFKASKVRLAGTRLTDSIADVIAEVKTLMPVENDTVASMAILENAIESSYDDLNGVADKFDAYLAQAAIDLQRHVPFYQVRQITTFLLDGEGVTNEGFISRVALPETARIQQIWYGHYYPPLEADVEYAADDILISNGRAYKVITGGTLTVYELADGLTSTDFSDEDLGDLVFRYNVPERDWPVRPFDWNRRNQLFAGDVGVGPLYAFPPQADQIWLYPALDDEHRFDLEWVGVAEVFEDEDEVTFDKTAAEAAAHYIRALLYQTELDDPKQAATSLALYQRAVRKAVVDNQARDTGSPPSVAPYDYRRRWRCCGVCGIVTANSDNGSTESMNINSENSQTNTGDVANVTAESPNHIETIAFNGSAGDVVVVLNINRQLPSGGVTRCTSGDRITILATFAVAAIALDLRNSTQGGAELGTFTSSDAGQVARLEFYYDGTQWQFLPP